MGITDLENLEVKTSVGVVIQSPLKTQNISSPKETKAGVISRG